MGRVIGNFGKLPGGYQVIPGNCPKLPITRVCRVRSYLLIRNQAFYGIMYYVLCILFHYYRLYVLI